MVKICATTVIAVLCIVVSIIAWTSPNPDQIFNDYGYSTDNMIAGRFYVPLTSIFLHADFSHLASNLFVLLIFGLVLEQEIGCRRYLLVFFAGAFLGDFLSTFVYAPAVPSIGASGGVFSIVAATMLIKPVPIEGFVPIPLGVIAVAYILYAIVGLLFNYPPHVSHIAHLGGALVGLIYGCKKKGLKSTLKILVAVTIILILFPIIWEIWALIANLIVGLFGGG